MSIDTSRRSFLKSGAAAATAMMAAAAAQAGIPAEIGRASCRESVYVLV